ATACPSPHHRAGPGNGMAYHLSRARLARFLAAVGTAGVVQNHALARRQHGTEKGLGVPSRRLSGGVGHKKSHQKGGQKQRIDDSHVFLLCSMSRSSNRALRIRSAITQMPPKARIKLIAISRRLP